MVDDDGRIFGFTWDEILTAQRGGTLPRTQVSGPAVKPLPTDADRALLAEHGSIEALEAAGLFGVVDRLRNGGVV